MNKSIKKNRVSFKSILKLSLGRERIANKIITIILSTFTFMLFAIGTTGFTYNKTSYIERVYSKYLEDKSYFSFCSSGGDISTRRLNIKISDVRVVEEKTQLSFVYDIGYEICPYWGYYVADNKSGTIYDKWESTRINTAGAGALAGSEEDYEGMGFTLLAGRYPTEENEIAVSEAHYEAFHLNGYYDASKNFVWINYYESGWYDYGGSVSGEATEINCYSDILGKTIGKGDIENDEHAYAYTIVGVVDTNYSSIEDLPVEEFCDYPEGRILFSDIYKTKYIYTLEEYSVEDGINCIYHGTNISRAKLKECVRISLGFFEERGDDDFPALECSATFFNETSCIEIFGKEIELTQTQWIFIIFGGAGIFFGIFAAILNGHLISRSVDEKQKKIGILRAMGADNKTVAKIFLTEVLLTATAIFLLALAASLIVFYCWINPWISWGEFGAGILVYNGWTVLILAAACYLVPLLSALAPLRKFFKKPIVDNITGNTQKAKRK